jgi:ABC-2 type transport system ATP-binding protein
MPRAWSRSSWPTSPRTGWSWARPVGSTPRAAPPDAAGTRELERWRATYRSIAAGRSVRCRRAGARSLSGLRALRPHRGGGCDERRAVIVDTSEVLRRHRRGRRRDLRRGGGESFGFLGPNGAGKSATINILCTLLRPTGGSASVAGFVASRPADVRRHIPRLQDPTLDEYLTPRRTFGFMRSSGVPARPPRTGSATCSRWSSSGTVARASCDVLRQDAPAPRDRPRAAALARVLFLTSRRWGSTRRPERTSGAIEGSASARRSRLPDHAYRRSTATGSPSSTTTIVAMILRRR